MMAKSDDTPAPGPRPEHKRLDVFVGRWETEGQITDPSSGRTSRLTAVDTYEWLPGEFFLLHRVDGRMGEAEVKAIEIIGFDASSRTYFTHSFDNQGRAAAYKATLEDGVWTITGDAERFRGEFSDDRKKLTGKWERSPDGSRWVPWMDIQLTKAGRVDSASG
jgi:hypothetical protein